MIERIYIPTVRRTTTQITYDNLPDELKKKVIMVVEPGERHLYNYPCSYLEIPAKLVGSWTQLAETRLFIHKLADDDIVIGRRNSDTWNNESNMEKSRRSATSDEILEMFDTFDTWLDEDDIGVVGPSSPDAPPPETEYADTKGVFSFVAYDGRMLSEEIDNMDITCVRVAEDVLFIYECLSRGINTRLSTEWIMDNRSMTSKELKNTRKVWTEMYESQAEQPEDHFQTDKHYDALKIIQNKFPRGMKIFMKEGKRKNTKYWKRVYIPKTSEQWNSFFDWNE